MRSAWIAAALVLWLGGTISAQAGVYSTAEKPDGPQVGADGTVKPLPFDAFQDELSAHMDIRNPAKPQDKGRQKFLARRDELQARVKAGTATVQDQVNLSAYLIGLGEYDQALDLLKPLADDRTKHERNFMLFANLGTAYQVKGQLERADAYLAEARGYFPPAGQAAFGLSKEQLAWFREAEKYQLRLLRLRRREAINAPSGPPKAPETPDDLFSTPDAPGVRFVGPSGSFEAGKLADAEQAKLPKNALAIVQQLLLWLPPEGGLYDVRLFWFYGELLNARGEVKEAKLVLDACTDPGGLHPAELRDHRQVLLEALTQPVAEKPKPPPWVPETSQLIVVGSVAGVIMLLLGGLQVREIRRRRQANRSSAR